MQVSQSTPKKFWDVISLNCEQKQNCYSLTFLKICFDFSYYLRFKFSFISQSDFLQFKNKITFDYKSFIFWH